MTKARTGIGFFDTRYGGTYRGRTMLVSGRRWAGKTLAGLQFIKQGLAQGEPGLMLSAKSARDLAIQGADLGIAVDDASVNNRLFLLEYCSFMPGIDSEMEITLPAGCLEQITAIVENHGIRRVVLDTVLPWVQSAHQPEDVFSLVSSFEQLGVTSLLTLPKAVSPAARDLQSLLESLVPVSILLDINYASRQRWWTVAKYFGREVSRSAVEISIEPGVGLRATGEGGPQEGDARAPAAPWHGEQHSESLQQEPVLASREY